jgi:hypothetical protein
MRILSSGSRAQILTAAARLVFIALVMAAPPIAHAQSASWGPWQPIPDGHGNGTDISVQVARDGYGNNYDHTVFFRFRNRYDEMVNIRVAITLATALESGGTHLDTEEQTLRPGQIVQNGGAFSVGNHVASVRMARIQFGYPKPRAVFQDGRQICCDSHGQDLSTTASPAASNRTNWPVEDMLAKERARAMDAQIAAREAAARAAEQERIDQEQRAAQERGRQANIERAAEQQRASQEQRAAQERDRQASLERSRAEGRERINDIVRSQGADRSQAEIIGSAANQIAAIFRSPNPRTTEPSTTSETLEPVRQDLPPHVYRSANGGLLPEAGYRWLNPGPNADFRVVRDAPVVLPSFGATFDTLRFYASERNGVESSDRQFATSFDRNTQDIVAQVELSFPPLAQARDVAIACDYISSSSGAVIQVPRQTLHLLQGWSSAWLPGGFGVTPSNDGYWPTGVYTARCSIDGVVMPTASFVVVEP